MATRKRSKSAKSSRPKIAMSKMQRETLSKRTTEPSTRADRMDSRRSPPKLVSRGYYELMGAKDSPKSSRRDSLMRKIQVDGSVALVTKADSPPPLAADFSVAKLERAKVVPSIHLDSDLSTEDKTAYEVMAWQKEGWNAPEPKTDSKPKESKTKSEKKKSRRKWPYFLVAVIVVVVVASALTAHFLTRGSEPSPYKGRVNTVFNAYCMKERAEVKQRAECFVGSSPHESCSAGACIQSVYRLQQAMPEMGAKEEKEEHELLAKHRVDEENEGARLLCRRGDSKLGVCSEDGKCDQEYGGQDVDTASLEKASHWEDSCDEVNTCWDNESNNMFANVTVTRDECRDQVLECQGQQHAVVWMQHLRCQMGNLRIKERLCKGLPLRLWLCKRCNFTESAKSNCTGLADGVKCQLSEAKQAYCFRGQCFKVDHEVGMSPLLTSQECRDGKGAGVAV